MQPAFHRQRLARMAQTMIDATQAMLACWRPGEVRNVNQEMMELTLRIVARTLFSTEVDEDLDRIRNANSTTNEHFRSRLFTLMTVLPDRVPTPGNVRYQRGLRSLHVLVERIVRERRASGEPGDDLLGMLLSARDEAGQGMTDRQLRDEVLTLLEAGHDTTALALTWSFVLLAQHPEEDERLFSDTLRVIGNRPPRVEDAPQLTYADHIVSETLRLRPTAWAINREAVRDTLVGGQRVPRGTTVLISPWVLHRDPRFWDEPDSFVPDRWSNGGPAKRFAYIPFGAGQRICIGAAFAQLEATLLLAGIVRCYRLALADPAARVEAWPVVTLRTREDVQMRLSPRTGSF
jgi:cytochrome P450